MFFDDPASLATVKERVPVGSPIVTAEPAGRDTEKSPKFAAEEGEAR
jgi:hypothetical protein